MKKIIALFICVSLLIVNSAVLCSAEGDDVLGLEKFFDEMWLGSDYNSVVRVRMQESYAEILESRVNTAMNNPDIAKKKMGIKLGDYDYEEKQARYMFTLDTDKGVLVNSINTIKYSIQYAQAGCLSYLFNKNKLFKVPGKVHDGGEFSIDGNYLTRDESEKIYNSTLTIIDDGVLDYLKDHKNLENELLKKGETAVSDMSLFSIGYFTFLYIKGEVNEYLIEVRHSSGKNIPKIESYVLYTASELLNAFSDLAEKTLTTKPTYDNEAQSLQADGLLQGNENGLDLLKPLTRIEATAILVRAMGLEDTPTSETSYFTDIQSDNWGAKYANIAHDKGIASGVGDNFFAPNDTITASQFATLILRNQGENPDWQTAINIFIERGLITSEQADKMDIFTRGDMAKIIYEAKQKDLF